MKEVVELIARAPAWPAKTPNFAKFGSPTAPGACHWCGRMLKGAKIANDPRFPEWKGTKGDYGDNAFCGLRCGFAFGVTLAIAGRRLQMPTSPVPTQPAPPTPAGGAS